MEVSWSKSASVVTAVTFTGSEEAIVGSMVGLKVRNAEFIWFCRYVWLVFLISSELRDFVITYDI